METLPRYLVLDVGNSRTKAALFGPDRALAWTTLPNGDNDALDRWLAGYVPAAAVVGSVAARDGALLEHLAALCPVLEVMGDTPAPLQNGYGTPLSLGADRLANAVGAVRCFPGRPVLAIDAGTCITCDLVEADGTYHGGTISPGIRLRALAMHGHSARLPLVEPSDDPAPLGNDTRASLEAGIHHGVLGELRGFMTTFGHERPDMAVVLTGGDAPRFARALKSGIFAHPLLTLTGLHAILLYNRPLHLGDGPGTGDGRGAGPAG